MKSVLLCVTAGRGPAECRAAMAQVVEVMRAEALETNLGFSAEPAGHRASLIVSLDGEDAEHFAKCWLGSVQCIDKSELRPTHRRKNWFVAVVRLTPPKEMPEVRLQDLHFEALCAGGPGGQHQNKTASAVRVLHVPTGLAVVARDERSQHRNKALAIERLQGLLAAINERESDSAKYRDWLARIEIERGNPVRVLKGAKK